MKQFFIGAAVGAAFATVVSVASMYGLLYLVANYWTP